MLAEAPACVAAGSHLSWHTAGRAACTRARRCHSCRTRIARPRWRRSSRLGSSGTGCAALRDGVRWRIDAGDVTAVLVLACFATREEAASCSLQAAVQAGKARPGNLLTRSLIRLHTPELLQHTFWTVTEIGIRWGQFAEACRPAYLWRRPVRALSHNGCTDKHTIMSSLCHKLHLLVISSCYAMR